MTLVVVLILGELVMGDRALRRYAGRLEALAARTMESENRLTDGRRIATTAQAEFDRFAEGHDRRIEELASEKYGHTKLLRQVKGVGPITSLAYVLTLEK